MLDLSCVDLSVSDLLKCSFGLSQLELEVLTALLETDGMTGVSELSDKMDRDRSVVQRGLSSLMEKSLVRREQSNKDGGGYLYLYCANGKKKIKKSILEKSRSFCSLVKETVNRW